MSERCPPAFLQIILHYFYSPEPYDRRGPPHVEMHQRLVNASLLKPLEFANRWGACYEITDRGRAYVEALCRTPLPVQVWVIPEEERP